MPYTGGQKTNFPELTHTKHQPSAFSIDSSDGDAEATHIPSSKSLGSVHGHISGDERMNNPWQARFEPGDEPLGSAPGSGEGVNAGSKPEGRDIRPERA